MGYYFNKIKELKKIKTRAKQNFMVPLLRVHRLCSYEMSNLLTAHLGVS